MRFELLDRSCPKCVAGSDADFDAVRGEPVSDFRERRRLADAVDADKGDDVRAAARCFRGADFSKDVDGPPVLFFY